MRIDNNSEPAYHKQTTEGGGGIGNEAPPTSSWRSSMSSTNPSLNDMTEKKGTAAMGAANSNGNAPAPPHTLWGRFKASKTRVALLVTFLTLSLLAAIVVPIVFCGLDAKQDRSNANGRARGPNGQPITTPSSPDYRDPFNDHVQAHEFSPPLDEKFQYDGRDKVRGINLGGWLVLEPFITPKIFEQAANQSIMLEDENALCKFLGPKEAKRQLTAHYDTFITEADFKKIAEMGFNHVRIPTGHWAVQVDESEPYVPYVSWQYLLKGIQWARKYGLRVMVELHTAPGSQNGWNHSGKSGEIGFLNGTHGAENAERTVQIVTEMIRFFDKPEWANVVPLFGVLNEPAMMKMPSVDVKSWYESSYNAIRKLLGPGGGPLLTYHDGFYSLESWKGFFGKQYERTVLETHLYLIFNNGLVSMPRAQQAEFPCTAWKKDIINSSRGSSPIMVGEFSIATNDCGKYLNGIGLGARYDGSLKQDGAPTSPVCPTCTCKGVDDWKTWTPEYKDFLLQFMEKQMESYEASIGWFYWTYKTEDHVNPHWDYSLAWEQGFAPKNVNILKNKCAKQVSTPVASATPAKAAVFI